MLASGRYYSEFHRVLLKILKTAPRSLACFFTLISIHQSDENHSDRRTNVILKHIGSQLIDADHH